MPLLASHSNVYAQLEESPRERVVMLASSLPPPYKNTTGHQWHMSLPCKALRTLRLSHYIIQDYWRSSSSCTPL